jgi:hypothetical protein
MTVRRQNDAREPLVGVRELAEYLSVAPSYVYEHADQLGARRLGTGPKPRLRFSLSEVDERLSACSASRQSDEPISAPQAASRRRARPALGTNVELLPIRGRIRAQEAS